MWLHLSGEKETIFPRRQHWTSSVIPACWCISGFFFGKGSQYPVWWTSQPWIRLPTFISEAFHIPSPACRCQRICRRGAAAVPAAVRRVCTERQLTGSWPLWFAGPEREAAWVYSTLLQRITMSIFRSGPQEVVLYDCCRRVRAVSECNWCLNVICYLTWHFFTKKLTWNFSN